MPETAAVLRDEDPTSPHLRLTPRAGSPRRRVLYLGILADPGMRATWRVTVREISSEGVQVFLAGPDPLPPDLVLIIPRHGLGVRVRMVWRRSGRAGFAFERRLDLTRPRTDDHHWLRALWLEALPR